MADLNSELLPSVLASHQEKSYTSLEPKVNDEEDGPGMGKVYDGPII